jgi:TctA family transporter
MVATVIKAIIGLFVWMVLPQLFFKKKKRKKSPYKQFVFIVCTIIGILIIGYSVVDLLKMLEQ